MNTSGEIYRDIHTSVISPTVIAAEDSAQERVAHDSVDVIDDDGAVRSTDDEVIRRRI